VEIEPFEDKVSLTVRFIYWLGNRISRKLRWEVRRGMEKSVDELKEILNKVESGELPSYHKYIQVAIAEKEEYDGSLVNGETSHFFIEYKQRPDIDFSLEENIRLGYVIPLKGEEKPRILKRILVDSSDLPYYRKWKIVYWHPTAGFSIWISHRGHTGDRIDNYDKIVDSRNRTIGEVLEAIYRPVPDP
jgi:hypothetical protein